MTEPRATCGAKNEELRCFRAPHHTREHVADSGESWLGCPAQHYGETTYHGGGASTVIEICKKVDGHDGAHVDQHGVEFWNDRAWEYVEVNVVQTGDILRDLAMGEPFVVNSVHDGKVHYDGGGTHFGGAYYRLKARGYSHGRFTIVKTETETVHIATFRDLLGAFWKVVKLKLRRKK